MFNINKILKPRYLLVLLVLGGGALLTMLQATSNQCVSTASGDLTEQSTFGTYNNSEQSGCGSNLALDYIISAGNSVSWSGFEGPISGNVEVKSGGSLDINGNATFGGTLTNAGTLTVEASSDPETPTPPTSTFFTISNISGHTKEDGTTSTFDVRLNSAPSENVIVSVSSSDTAEATVSPATLTFTPANYNSTQQVTVTGVNDSDIDGHEEYEISLSAATVPNNPEVTTLAGSSSGSTDATGTSASFNDPVGITTDGTNLYVADNGNHRIRKIVISTGVVTTLAGSSQGSTDTADGTPSFKNPKGITTDGTNLYVADYSNHRIRKIVISTGVVTTLAGSSSGSTDATGTSASFYNPLGITTDGTNLYVADYNNHRIRKIVISTGVVTTLAGSSSGTTDATGTSASFSNPTGITTDGTNLYVADFGNNRIRKIVIDNGTVTTLAGSSTGFLDNATGTSAKFKTPWGITTDGTNLYVADHGNHKIRKIE